MTVPSVSLNYNSCLDALISNNLIDQKRFAYDLNHIVGGICFWDGKFVATPEALFDLWTYYGIEPNIYLEYMALYVDNLKPGHVLDFVQRFLDFAPGQKQQLISHQFEIYATCYESLPRTRTFLGVHYLIAPLPARDITLP